MRTVHTKNDVRGFTLAELLVVVAIIAVLVAVSIPIFSAKLEKAREATDIANMRAAKACAITYVLEDNIAANVYNMTTNPGGVFKNDNGNTSYIADYDAYNGKLVRPGTVIKKYGQGTDKPGGTKTYMGYSADTDTQGLVIRVSINRATDEITMSWGPY